MCTSQQSAYQMEIRGYSIDEADLCKSWYVAGNRLGQLQPLIPERYGHITGNKTTILSEKLLFFILPVYVWFYFLYEAFYNFIILRQKLEVWQLKVEE